MFEPPADYATLGPGRSEPMRDEDDNLLQFAIQQSLLDAGTESDQVGSPAAKLLCLQWNCPLSYCGAAWLINLWNLSGDHLGSPDQQPPDAPESNV